MTTSRVERGHYYLFFEKGDGLVIALATGLEKDGWFPCCLLSVIRMPFGLLRVKKKDEFLQRNRRRQTAFIRQDLSVEEVVAILKRSRFPGDYLLKEGMLA